MGRLNRFVQKVFGSTAGATEVGKFGSLAAGAPAYITPGTPDLKELQSLSQYDGGWYDAIVGFKNFAIQDRNALDFLFGYQLAYLMQVGVPEWNADTDYHTGQIVNSAGVLYVSIANANTSALTDGSKWQPLIGRQSVKRITVSDSPYTVLNSDQVIEADCSGGAIGVTLPSRANSVGRIFTFDRVDDSANALTISRAGADLFEAGDTSYVMDAAFQSSGVFAGTTFWKVR